MAVATVALFSCPDLSTTGKIVWTAVFYFLYSMLATALQIPYDAQLLSRASFDYPI